MKYDVAVELETLAADLFHKRAVFEAHCMRNTPATYEEREKSFIEMEVARHEMLAAERKLARSHLAALANPIPDAEQSGE